MTQHNPLASAHSVVLTDDPAIDKRAMGKRDYEALSEDERTTRALPALDAGDDALCKAFDKLGAEAHQRYVDTRDTKHLAYKPGMQPSVFKVAPMRASFMAMRIDGDASQSNTEGLMLAVRASVLQGVTDDGKIYRPGKTETDSTKQAVADEDWIETIREQWGMSAVYNLGAAALILSRLPAKARPPLPSSAG